MKKALGVSIDMMLTISKSQLFHELAEQIISENGGEFSSTYPYLGHFSLRVIDEELRFAALMGKEEFTYQLNMHILNFGQKLENNSQWPEHVQEIVREYLDGKKKDKKQIKIA